MEAGEPQSLACIAPEEERGREVGGEFSVAMFCGSLLSGGSMGQADFEG